jgi:hypothetical protein
MWLYSHIKRHDAIKREESEEKLRVICTFINPSAAEGAFRKIKEVVSDTFEEELAEMDAEYKKLIDPKE